MRDTGFLLEQFKKIAIDAINSTNPVAVRYGTVTSLTPLTVMIDQKLILRSAQLVMTKAVQNVNVNERVVLLREQGGKKYVMIGVVL